MIRHTFWTCSATVCLALLQLPACTQAPTMNHAAAAPAPAKQPPGPPQIRSTGIVKAVRFTTVLVPQISGQGGRMTLTRIVPNGSAVKPGDILAEFDRTQQLDNAREAQARFNDLSHQVEQRKAQNRSDAAKRSADLQRAEAEVAKALLDISKGSLLSEIDRLKADVRLADARETAEGLRSSMKFRDVADAAALRVLELQRDRQKVALDRAGKNAEKMQVRASLAGMVALESVWRQGSMGHPQEGDQLWRGEPLLQIFDPSEMEVQTTVGEPDGAVLAPGCRAEVRLDAYPDLLFEAQLISASPVAASAIGSPIKSFSARFRLGQSDPHLLPDLSAAVTIRPGATVSANRDQTQEMARANGAK